MFSGVKSLRNQHKDGGAFRTNLIRAFRGIIAGGGGDLLGSVTLFAFLYDTRSRDLQHRWNMKILFEAG